MEPKKALEIINDGICDIIDYGKINGTDFFCTCGVGFDAFVSLKFANAGKRGLLTYLEKTLQESLTYQPETYELEGERRYVQNGERFKNGNIQKTVCQGGLWCYIGVVAIL